jgi:HEAT repeat protein
VQALSPLLADDPDLRAAVTQRLDDDNWMVRQAAVQALSPLLADDPDLRAAVTQRLDDDNWMVRQAAVQALSPLLAQQPELIPQLLPWLACVGDWMGPVLTAQGYVSASIAATEVRQGLAQALGPLLPENPVLMEQVRETLARPDWPAREGAARALGAIPGGPPSATIPALLQSLDDRRGLESWPARLAAASILINRLRHAQKAIAVVLEALDYGTAPWEFLYGARGVRSEAALILGRLEPVHYDYDPAVFARLARLMQEDEDEEVRDAAYQALLALAQAPAAAAGDGTRNG